MACTGVHQTTYGSGNPGTVNSRLHYTVTDRGQKWSVVRIKFNIPLNHPCLDNIHGRRYGTRIVPLGRAQHSEAVDLRKNKANDHYHGLVSRTIWKGAGNAPTPPVPNVAVIPMPRPPTDKAILRDFFTETPSDEHRGSGSNGAWGGW